jgi:hypothetical protein
MFSSKKKNVELNLMFISQANNIGNSEIPVSLSPKMSQRKTLSKVPLIPQFITNGLSYTDVIKFDKSNHIHVWDHSYSTATSIPLNFLTSYHEKHHLQSHTPVYHPVQFEDWG